MILCLQPASRQQQLFKRTVLKTPQKSPLYTRCTAGGPEGAQPEGRSLRLRLRDQPRRTWVIQASDRSAHCCLAQTLGLAAPY